MSAIGRRVRAERDVWKAVWQQMETYLDRVDSCADQDHAYADTLCALLAVIEVVERARKRALGYGLEKALAALPGGKTKDTQLAVTLDVLLDDTTGDPQVKKYRVPGLEVCELAAAPIAYDKDDDKSPSFQPTVVLATFRDAKHHLEGERWVPAYDNGKLTIPVDGDGDPISIDQDDLEDDDHSIVLFTVDDREHAANGDEFTVHKWHELRDARLEQAEKHKEQQAQQDLPLWQQLEGAGSRAALEAIGVACDAAADACEKDRKVLGDAKQRLDDAGAPSDVLDAVGAAEHQLHQQVDDYRFAAAHLRAPLIDQLTDAILAELRYRLFRADAPSGPGLSPVFAALDEATASAFDQTVDARIAYPDGPLRMLRLLEQGLRFYWNLRSKWMIQRFDLLTRQLGYAFWAAFTDSLAQVIAGQPSGLILPAGTTTLDVTNARATRLRVTGVPLPMTFWPGRLVRLAGERPAAAVVIDLGFDPKKGLFLTTTPVELSFAIDPGLPGVPGVIAAGTALATDFPRIDDAEWRRGASKHGAAHDALITGLVAHGSRLALLLGSGAPLDRPAAPAIPAPYPGIPVFELDGPVPPEAARLFLHALPPAAQSGTGELLMVARPGELMLIRGQDEDGFVWQGVVEVDHCDVLTGADARKDDQIAQPPAPPCCEDDQPVMIVYVRSMQMPTTLVSHVTLRRDFLGFGVKSVLAGAVLPDTLDGATTVPSVLQDGETRLVLRDHELTTATKVFEDWLGRDTGGTAP